MNFAPNPDYDEIREAIRRVCKRFDDSYWREMDDAHQFPWEFYDALAAGGWIGIAIPTAYGGGGQGITEASILLEEVAASGAAMNGASALHLSIFGMNAVVRHGSEEMKRAYLPLVAEGKLHVAFGVTEPDAGTDTTSITTRARRVGDEYIVRGRKVWTTKARDCQKVLLLVRTTPLEECVKRTDGMTLLLADLQRPEVDIVPIDKAGRNAVESCEVRYDDLPVAVSERVGEEGRGFDYLLDGLNPERILVASEALGIGKVSLRRAVDYANTRVVFGRPIGKNQRSRSRWPRRTSGCTPPNSLFGRLHGDMTTGCRAASKRISPSGWRPKPVTSRPTGPCRPMAGLAMPRSTTLSDTGASQGS